MTDEEQEILKMTNMATLCHQYDREKTETECERCLFYGKCHTYIGAKNLYEAGYRNTKTILNDLAETIKDIPILDEPQKQFLKGVVMGMRIKYGVKEKDNE